MYHGSVISCFQGPNSEFTLSLDDYAYIFEVTPNIATGSATASIIVRNQSLVDYESDQKTYIFNVSPSGKCTKFYMNTTY